jgi:putative ABC transport system permease protein
LVLQFLSESTIINGISVALAFVLVYFLSPIFYDLTGLSFSFLRIYESGLTSPGIVVALVFSAGVFMSGWYPAKIISSHNPASVLKAKFTMTGDGLNLRKVLVVFQFTCAIVLTIAVMTSNHQFRFMQRQDLGVDINKTLVVKAPTTFATAVGESYMSRMAAFKNDLQARAVISSVATSSSVPGEKVGWTGMVRKGESESGPSLSFMINVVDIDFISAFGLQLLAGRNFEISDYPGEQFGMKTEPVILNRTAVNQLGFSLPEDIIDHTIYWESNRCLVVGVVNDFHQQSLKEVLQPMLFTANNGPMLSIKLGKAVNDSNLAESVSIIRDAWKIYFPDNPFDYFLLEDFYSQQYVNDKQVMNLFQVFCGIAILISSLGLFALSTVAARQRLKEMGIRRVLAVPIAWLGMERWLQSFVFHINSSAWLYIVPVLIVLVIASITICVQTFKVIHTNPAEILKCE